MKLSATKIFSALFAFFLAACASSEGVLIEDQPYALTEIRKAISNVFNGKIRETSQNGRELDSPYYGKKFEDPDFNPETAKERYSAHIEIMGDRRPYTIKIMVNLEKKSQGIYNLIGEDPKQSQIVAKKVMDKLHESIDRRNYIDDFRPY